MKSTLNQIRAQIKSPSEKQYFDIHVDRYRHILSQIKRLHLSASSKILDIGAYPPHLFKILSTWGYQVQGISSPHEAIKHPHIKTLNIESKNLPFKKNSFDLVLFTEIIEHLTVHPQKVLIQIKRVLKPSGYLLLTTPNVLRSQNLFSLIIRKNIYFPLDQLKQLSYHRHNREYTRLEIIDLLQSAGFKIIRSHHFIAYTPFRSKNRHDTVILKLTKIINHLFMTVFPGRRDNIFVLAQI